MLTSRMTQMNSKSLYDFHGKIVTSAEIWPVFAEVTLGHYPISAEVSVKQLKSCGSSAEVTPVFAEVSYGSKLPYPIYTLLPHFRGVDVWAWMVCGSGKMDAAHG